jgi:phenylacetate-coenzyme A ligase PaaK-like adenylate-forming protein
MLEISHPAQFETMALAAFGFQYEHNPIYRKFCDYMHVMPKQVKVVNDIPFLPIELFKNHKIVCGGLKEQIIFRSSGTTGSVRSEHYIIDLEIYNKVLIEGFKAIFGDPAAYCFIALLPGYIERPDSSLIHMVHHLMQQGLGFTNAFFKEPNQEFIQTIQKNQAQQIPTILFGVSYSLMELAKKNPIHLEGITLIETGGMKGKTEEKTKSELHALLKEKLHLSKVYSEYGMTELLSQAYCSHQEEFELPPWMQIRIRETNDPKSFLGIGKGGGINVIDLANIYSCCFIATQDLGKKTSPNTFEVLGRFDNADIRGCNLLFA